MEGCPPHRHSGRIHRLAGRLREDVAGRLWSPWKQRSGCIKARYRTATRSVRLIEKRPDGESRAESSAPPDTPRDPAEVEPLQVEGAAR
ncbi:hypothetical protein EYF80_054316 [Liparis tanakae]|uniref:Uncharacterized protein n=1 Tax=Liparis tanakae TaxID=230148 RepID=A0A4Z2F318_9TELE|nr:hypothetical protein EYF80_054316 [Liparis tanakae]